ncbi:MAG: hypothetical protein ACI82G_001223 [Bradymonadia bacterium]|jgi:hypothetical protein
MAPSCALATQVVLTRAFAVLGALRQPTAVSSVRRSALELPRPSHLCLARSRSYHVSTVSSASTPLSIESARSPGCRYSSTRAVCGEETRATDALVRCACPSLPPRGEVPSVVFSRSSAVTGLGTFNRPVAPSQTRPAVLHDFGDVHTACLAGSGSKSIKTFRQITASKRPAVDATRVKIPEQTRVRSAGMTDHCLPIRVRYLSRIAMGNCETVRSV